jgi:hypothetical protein
LFGLTMCVPSKLPCDTSPQGRRARQRGRGTVPRVPAPRPTGPGAAASLSTVTAKFQMAVSAHSDYKIISNLF